MLTTFVAALMLASVASKREALGSMCLFLERVEQDRLDKLNPPEDILQARDKYLAFAIALEVKEAWGDHLAQTFSQLRR